MKQRRRIYYTEAQKAPMWERWQKGESLQHIAQLLDRNHSSVQRILAETGGIRPAQRHRSRLALTLAERMRHTHVGDIVVVEYRNGEAVPVGLVTDRDLVVAVMASGEDADQFTAGQIMSRGLIVVSETDEIGVALDEMRRSGVRRLPVVDDSGRLTGIVALDDIVEYLASLLSGIAEVSKLQRMEEQRFRT